MTQRRKCQGAGSLSKLPMTSPHSGSSDPECHEVQHGHCSCTHRKLCPQSIWTGAVWTMPVPVDIPSGRQTSSQTAGMLQSLTGQSSISVRSSLPIWAEEPKAASLRGWLTKDEGRTFGRNEGLGHRVTPVSPDPHCRHSWLTEKACNSPTLLADATARRKAVLRDSHLSSASPRGSKGTFLNASSTRGRSHGGVWFRRRGLSH